MTTYLTPYEEQIIAGLDESIGSSTRNIAEQCGKAQGGIGNRASQSALVLHSLKRLQKRGFVRRMDDELPAVWVLVKRGGAA